MKRAQHAALVGMVNAILGLAHLDEFSRHRARRLLAKLGAEQVVIPRLLT